MPIRARILVLARDRIEKHAAILRRRAFEILGRSGLSRQSPHIFPDPDPSARRWCRLGWGEGEGTESAPCSGRWCAPTRRAVRRFRHGSNPRACLFGCRIGANAKQETATNPCAVFHALKVFLALLPSVRQLGIKVEPGSSQYCD
jgi:hypothetical protein